MRTDEQRRAGAEPTPSAEHPAARGADLACERDRIIAILSSLVEPLGQSLPPSTEVVLHDLSRLPDSIVGVHGDVTMRRLGDPATDLLLEHATAGDLDTMVGYRTTLPDGRPVRSTTIVIRDPSGEPVAALCLNTDLSVWQSLERTARSMTGADDDVAPAGRVDGLNGRDEPTEVFVRDVDELAAHLVHQAIREQGIPVALMKKEHKLAVVRSLKARGMFLLRDAVGTIAASLGVTRFTIYNYLNEIGEGATPVLVEQSPTISETDTTR
jgi:predicted transcriptional regulator YheO